MVAYSPLLKGGYVRQDKLDAAEFDHPGTPARLAALREVAEDAGATVNQVVLAWLIDAEIPMIPLVGASSVAQLVVLGAPCCHWQRGARPCRLDFGRPGGM